MKRYTLHEEQGDIRYEVEGDYLILKVRPEFVSNIPVWEGIYVVRTNDPTVPSDYNVFSASRTMEEIEKMASSVAGMIKPVEQLWTVISTDPDGGELPEDERYITPVSPYTIFSAKNITATGSVSAGYASPSVEDPERPIAGYEAVGYARFDSTQFDVDTDGLVHLKEGAEGGTGEFKDLTLITSTGTEEPTDFNVYTALAVKNLLANVDGKPTALWKSDKETKYLYLQNEAETVAYMTVDLTSWQNISSMKRLEAGTDVVCHRNITAEGNISAEGAVWAGLASTTVASSPIAGYTAIGMCRFDSSQFTVAADGLVKITGEIGGGTESYWGTSTTNYAWAYLDGVGKQVSLYGHAHSNLTVKYGSVSDATGIVYNATEAKTVTIPSDTSHLSNGMGYIYDATNTTTPILYLSNSGTVTQYLRGDGKFETISDDNLSHVASTSRYVDKENEQTITGQKWFDGKGTLLVGPSNNVHIQLGLGSGNCIHGLTSTGAMGNLYFNYKSDSSFIKCDPNDNFIASGSVIAGATSSAYLSNDFPIAGTSAKGICYFDSTQFSVTNGKVSILSSVISGGGGGGSTVSWSGGILSTNGTKIGTLTIDGSGETIYTPKVEVADLIAKTTLNSLIGTITVGSDSYPIYCTQGIANISTLNSNKSTVTDVSYNFSERKLTITKGDVPAHSHSYLSSISAKSDGTTGNVITGISASGGTITYSKGTISGGSGSSYWSLSDSSIVTNYWLDVVNSQPHIRFRSPDHSYNWSINNGKENLNVYCAQSSASPLLYVNYKSGVWVNNSDERLKNIYSELKDNLSKIDRISTFYYTWNGDTNDHELKIGVGALSVKTVYPELATQSTDECGSPTGYYGVQYSLLSVVAIAGIKELHSLVKTQRAHIDSLLDWRAEKEEEIKGLYRRIEALEAIINNNL